MKKLIVSLLFGLILFGLSFAQSEKMAVGTWNGALEVSGIELRLVFNITDSTGALTSTMDSPDQNAYDIPMDSVFFKNDSLRIVGVALNGVYTGVISEDGMTLQGNWVQGGMTFTLDLEKGDKVELIRPQEPKEPYPYLEENITFENKSGAAKLVGTFTKPKTGVPFPAVLMITGSGAQDRDEMIFGHKPFKVIADHLTRLGIAVLRVDDRGFGESTGDLANATTEDFAGDVRAGVEYLKSRDDVDKTKIGLIGHSEGAIIAPMVAAESDDVAFIILMAGTGIQGDELLKAQGRLIGRAEGISPEAMEAGSELQQKLFDIIRQEQDDETAARAIYKAMGNWRLRLDSAVAEEIPEDDSTQRAITVKQLLTPWIKFFVDYDPAPTIRKVKCPVLAINGAMDIQVPSDINLTAIENALKEGGNENYKIVEFEGLNHLFQHCETGTVSEYGKIEETFAPEALKTMSDWILEITKK